MTVKFTNNASTTVGTGINTSATSLTVASASSFPSLSGADDYCYLTIQQSTGTVREVVKATALSGNTFTIVRAQDNTSAGTWSAGDIVELRMTAALLTDVIDAATVEGVKTNFQYTPTAGQTVFSGADNASNTMIINQAALVSVYLNGIRLVQGSDYSVSSANNTVTLTAGVTTADIVDVEVFGNFTGQSGAAVAITGGAISGASVAATTLSASGTATLNTFVSSNATISGGTINNVNIGGTTAGTVAATTLTANSVAVDNITIDGNEIDVSSGDLTIDVAGDIILDADSGVYRLKDNGASLLQIARDGSSSVHFYSAVSNMNMLFKGNDGGNTITALDLDMENGGRADFANDISVNDGRGLRLGSDDDSIIYNDGSNLYVKNNTSNQDIIFQGNDDGSASLEMLKLDSSNLGAATFSGSVTSAGLTSSGPINLTAGALAAAGNAGLSHRSSDNKVYLQAGTGGFNILDDQQNTHLAIDSAGVSSFYGNVGIGVIPTNFVNRKSLDIGLAGKIWGHTSATETGHGSNFYFDGAYKRIAANAATRHIQDGNGHTFDVASSSSANSGITWFTAQTINTSGNTTFGGNVNIAGGNLDVGTDSATVNFTDSNSGYTKYIEIGSTGATGNGDALLVVHAPGKGVGYFGYEAANDRLIIATDNGGGNNSIEFSVNAGTTTGGGTDNLNGATSALTINGSGETIVTGPNSATMELRAPTDNAFLMISAGYNDSGAEYAGLVLRQNQTNKWQISNTDSNIFRIYSYAVTAPVLQIDTYGVTSLGDGGGHSDLLRLKNSYSSDNSQRGAISWEDSSATTAQIDTRYDGSRVNMHFSHLYKNGYQTGNAAILGGLGTWGVHTNSPRTDIVFTSGTAVHSNRWGFGGGISGTNNVFYVINENNAGVYIGHGNQSWTAHSDERIKENIVDVGTVLPSLMGMRCVKYNLVSNPDSTKIGFIAQDWESSFPEVVDENDHLVLEDDGTIGTNDESDSTTPVKAMAYTETIPLLLKAIQELSAKVDEQAAKITALETN